MSVEESIATSVRMCEANEGPEYVLFVCGNRSDATYWEGRARSTAGDVFRRNGTTTIHGIAEDKRLGSFLGTLNAWSSMRDRPRTEISLMSMVFGEGRRLSPFTQALRNRKAAFTTPRFGNISGEFLNAAEMANLYANSWLYHLRARGFQGVLVKWGDEAVLPGISVPDTKRSLADVDIVRFVWQVRPTSVLASQKDWFLIDRHDRLVVGVLPRQPLESLTDVLSRNPSLDTGVNLGSVAVTPTFLDAALTVFSHEVESGAILDWDPHFCVALLAASGERFCNYCDQQAKASRPFSPPAGNSVEDFYQKTQQVRALVRQSTGRDLRIGTLDFGEALWLDFGLQPTLGEIFADLPRQTSRGDLLRRAFGILDERDARGNIIVESTLPANARIEDSVLLRSTIEVSSSQVREAVLIDSHLGSATLCGGAIIKSSVGRLAFTGRGAIAFKVKAERLSLDGGGRATSIAINGEEALFTASEDECNDPDMFAAVLNNNPMSFADLSRLVGAKAEP